MDNRLYKQQMNSMRPVVESTGWEDTKIVSAFILAAVLLLGGLAGISFVVAGLFR
jgi:hypothetical protein